MRLATRILLFVLLLPTATAAKVTPPHEFTSRRIISRPSGEESLRSASNGASFLVLRRNEFGIHYNITNASGVAREPFGFFIPTERFPGGDVDVVGTDFVLAWKEANTVHIARSSPDGSITSHRILTLEVMIDSVRIEGNGEDVVVAAAGSRSTYLIFLDRNLEERKRRRFDGTSFDVAISRTQVVFVEGSGPYTATRMSLEGESLDSDPIKLGDRAPFLSGSTIRIATDGEHFLIAWVADMGHSAHLSQNGVLSARGNFSASYRSSLEEMVWSGSHYLLPVGIHHTTIGGPVFLIRWDAAGALLESRPREIAFLTAAIPGVSLAFSSGRGVAFISGAGTFTNQLLAYPISSEGFFRLEDAKVVFHSAAPQQQPVSAAGERSVLVMWRETDEEREQLFFAEMTGDGPVAARPVDPSEHRPQSVGSITYDGAGYVLTYSVYDAPEWRWKLARIHPGGEITTKEFDLPANLRKAWSAPYTNTTLMLFSSGGILLGMRFDRDLNAIDPAPFVIASTAGYIGSIVIASDGFDFQLAWVLRRGHSEEIYTQQVTAAGVSTPPELIAADVQHPADFTPLQIAFGNDEYLVTYLGADERVLYGRVISRAGKPMNEVAFGTDIHIDEYKLASTGARFEAMVKAGDLFFWVPLDKAEAHAVPIAPATYSSDGWTTFVKDGAHYLVFTNRGADVETLGIRRLFFTRVAMDSKTPRRRGVRPR